MLLSDTDIEDFIDSRDITITTYDRILLQPSSIDVRLGRQFRTFNSNRYTHIDPAQQQDDLTTLVELDLRECFILHPGEFALATTMETIALSDLLAARLEGKSSLGRLGLMTHSTAGFIDPGFSGQITLELSNVSNLPIKLYPGMRIGQVCFFELRNPVKHPYGDECLASKYQNQRGPTPSQAWRNFRTSNYGYVIPD
ncbi:MAG: dCTP deaminase [Lawsonella sp.]|uniref:dCTP deaminase n=1 Tax=Lawsonella sp. TaxID=2041415 RepID=UPI002A752849|nr:dCTP deaminase [Lawsonella sp.]MDY2979522.1 dCTP deaminase [Lawsonella sp.]